MYEFRISTTIPMVENVAEHILNISIHTLFSIGHSLGMHYHDIEEEFEVEYGTFTR